MITGGFTLSTDNSLQFAAGIRDNLKDIFCVHIFVWAKNNVPLFRCLSVIYFHIISWFPPLIFFGSGASRVIVFAEDAVTNLPNLSSRHGRNKLHEIELKYLLSPTLTQISIYNLISGNNLKLYPRVFQEEFVYLSVEFQFRLYQISQIAGQS